MKYLITGGTGFIGAAIAQRLVKDGHRVRVLDNNTRGSTRRLHGVADDVELVVADIRDAAAVSNTIRGVDAVLHLAYINGTRFFYEQPELVLDVSVRGMLNVVDGCRHHGVGELYVASSSEVYQTPSVVPTPEAVPLVIPDPLNPRYSYGGGKILVELMALNYGLTGFDKVVIFRPHNVYGPDMGWEHVLPQFVMRLKAATERQTVDPLPFPIQGSGHETRAFNFIDDFVEGMMTVIAHGQHRTIYNIGTPEEHRILDVAKLTGAYFNRRLEIVPGQAPAGATPRRSPDIRLLQSFGYRPKVPLSAGLPKLADWYVEHASEAPDSAFEF